MKAKVARKPRAVDPAKAAAKELAGYKIRYANLHKSSRTRARRYRSITVDISLEEYIAIVQAKECHYCNDNIFRSSQGYGLDRKDNDLGYTLENSIPCCSHCNFFKGKFLSYAEMIGAIKLLQKLRKKLHIWEGFKLIKVPKKWFKKK